LSLLAQYTKPGQGIFGLGIELGGGFDKFKVDTDSYNNVINSFKDIESFRNFYISDANDFNWDAIAASIEGCDERALSYFWTLDNGNGTINNQSASIEGLRNHLNATGQAFDFTALKASLINTALNAGIMFIASISIQAITKGIDALTHSAEHCKERVDGLMSSYRSALDKADANATTVENIADRYEELSKGVSNLGENISLTTAEYAEYNHLVNQIADIPL